MYGIRSFEYEQNGAEGIVAALRYHEETGMPVKLMVASHPKDAVQQAPHYASVGRVPGKGRFSGHWRHLGEDDEPMGAGSHALCSGKSIEDAAAALALWAGTCIGLLQAKAKSPPHVFRQYSPAEVT